MRHMIKSTCNYPLSEAIPEISSGNGRRNTAAETASDNHSGFHIIVFQFSSFQKLNFFSKTFIFWVKRWTRASILL